MSDILSALFWFAVLVVVLAAGVGSVYAVVKWQRSLKEPVSDVNTLLAQFRELRARGKITKTEYQTIKTQLSYQIRDEMRNAKRRR